MARNLGDAQTRIDDLEERLARSVREREAAVRAHETACAEREKACADRERLQSQLSEAQISHEHLQSRIAVLEDEVRQKNEIISTLNQRIVDLNQRIIDLTAQVTTLAGTNSALTADVAALKAAEARRLKDDADRERALAERLLYTTVEQIVNYLVRNNPSTCTPLDQVPHGPLLRVLAGIKGSFDSAEELYNFLNNGRSDFTQGGNAVAHPSAMSIERMKEFVENGSDEIKDLFEIYHCARAELKQHAATPAATPEANDALLRPFASPHSVFLERKARERAEASRKRRAKPVPPAPSPVAVPVEPGSGGPPARH